MKDKKILVIGNMYALAKHLSEIVKEVYVIPGCSSYSDFATCVDIREDNIPEIMDFVLENDIDLTIAASEKAIKANIVEMFQSSDKLIFAPSAKSADIAISKSQGKRFLYKMHIPTPKFGFFDKLPNAIEYLKDAAYPLTISSDESFNGKDRACFSVFEHAKYFAEDLFSSGVSKIVIEEYVYGQYFSIYSISDGYQVLPLTSVKDFKFSENGDGGLYKESVGCYCPDQIVPFKIKTDIFNNVIRPTISKLETSGYPYVGILCVDAVWVGENEYMVLGFRPFFSLYGAQAILNNIDDDVYDLFDSCANGFFADEYEDIITNDNISVSCLIRSRKADVEIYNVNSIDSDISIIGSDKKGERLYSVVGDNFVLTSCAKTLSRAKKKLLEDVEAINFDGMKYRSDILG